MANETIFTWEGISLPSYWGGNYQSTSGLAAMDAIKATGANTISLVPNFFMQDQYSNEMNLNLDPRTESDTFDQVKQGIQDAVARGLHVVVKPHVETNNRIWRAQITPSDPALWFQNYKNMMVKYAKVAEAGGASMFVVGTEMRSMTDPTKVCSDGKTYTQKWIEIIDAVREVFHGKVTYAATDDEALKVQFWDHLDYIGVDAYFSMAPDGTYDPTLQQLIDAWIKPSVNWNSKAVYGDVPVVDVWKTLSEQWSKKVIFTEVGYGSYNGVNLSPGALFEGNGYDPVEQELCYKALYHVMENYGGQWLDGALLWSYQTTLDPVYVHPTDYTPQNKPAEAVITAGYSSPEHVTGIIRNGAGGQDRLDGGYHNDTLNGGGGSDILWGGAGNDELHGDAGDDFLDGYTGVDTAVFSGAKSDYTITRQADGSLIVADAQAGRDGTDTLTHIKYIRFADQSVELSMAPALPTLEITAASAVKAEGSSDVADTWTNFTFTVTRTNLTEPSPVATWTVTGLSANNVLALSGPVFFDAGSYNATIIVKVRADKIIEPDETFTVTLSNSINATIADNAGSAIGTIINDDPAPAPIVQFSTSNPAVSHSEGSDDGWTTYTYTVTRSGADLTANSTVNWTLSGVGSGFDALDVENLTGTVTFTGGATSATIVVKVKADTALEENEAFTITLAPGTNASIGSNGTGSGAIVNDDVSAQGAPGVFLDPAHATTSTVDTAGNVRPFSGLTFADAENDVLALTISFAKNDGAITVPEGLEQFFDYDHGAADDGTSMVYTFRGTAAELGVIMDILQFDAAPRPGALVGEIHTTAFTIKVKDATHENTPGSTQVIEVKSLAGKVAFDDGSTAKSVNELALNDTEIGTLTLEDSEHHPLSYTLVGDGAGGRFKLDATGTKVVVDKGFLLDFEQAKTYTIRVKVHTTSGDFEQDLTININDVAAEVTQGSAANDTFKGGAGVDIFGGGLGNDKLWGGGGKDVLTGGSGSDTFVFSTAFIKSTNVDRITDYNAAEDAIWIENALFRSNKILTKAIGKGTETNPAKLASKFFTIGSKAKDKDDFFVLDTKKLTLSYDADGSGSKSAVAIATFTKSAMKGFSYKELLFI